MTPLRFKGRGLNTHGQVLPVASVLAAGYRWVTCDPPGPEDLVSTVIRLYEDAGLPALMLVPHWVDDAPGLAQMMVRAGAVDLQLGVEPQDDWMPNGRSWGPEEYGKWFASIRKAVGYKVRLYGPGVSRYTGRLEDPKYLGAVEYAQRAMKSGMSANGVTFNGYGTENLGAACRQMQMQCRLPVLVPEDGPVKKDGSADGSDPAGFDMARRAHMGELPSAYYTACGDKKEPRRLFDWDGSAWQPNALMARLTNSFAAGRKGGRR